MVDDKKLRAMKPLMVTLGNTPVVLMPRRFKSGNRGWFGGGKCDVGSEKVQFTMNITVIHSSAELNNGPEAPEVGAEPENAQKAPKRPRRSKGDLPQGLAARANGAKLALPLGSGQTTLDEYPDLLNLDDHS